MKNTIIPKNTLYHSNHGWLKSYHIFSFANYYDSQNISFWNLRVFNDDTIKAGTGFWLHPHENVEILTIVLDGEITHGDTLGNKQTTTAWEIQTMTAGTGILHSEENMWQKDVHLYQIWFTTHTQNLSPEYTNHSIDFKNNELTLLASWEEYNWTGFLNSEIKVYRWIFDAGKSFDFDIMQWKGLFLYIHSWKIEIEGSVLQKRDQLRYELPWKYGFEVKEKSDFIAIEVSLDL